MDQLSDIPHTLYGVGMRALSPLFSTDHLSRVLNVYPGILVEARLAQYLLIKNEKTMKFLFDNRYRPRIRSGGPPMVGTIRKVLSGVMAT